MKEILEGAITGIAVSIILLGTSIGLVGDRRFVIPPGPAIPIRCVEFDNYVLKEPRPVWCCGDEACTINDVI